MPAMIPEQPNFDRMILPPAHFISCDWGTTNFRLRVVNTSSLAVLEESKGGLGIRALHEGFVQHNITDRLSYFNQYLRTKIQELSVADRAYPIIISGMASANIGMRELPYGEGAINCGGKHLYCRDFEPWPGQRLRLISGVKSEFGMMRGEETQALGLLEIMEEGEDGILLLPGTHSKHLVFTDGQFTDFTSYMTGEVFEVLSRNSLLSNSVAAGEWTAQGEAAFREGVHRGATAGLAASLFGIRADHILRQTLPTDNYYRLSGLLIGDELSRFSADTSVRVYLAGAGSLLRLYQIALEMIVGPERLVIYDDKVLERALLWGQRELLLR